MCALFFADVVLVLFAQTSYCNEVVNDDDDDDGGGDVVLKNHVVGTTLEHFFRMQTCSQ